MIDIVIKIGTYTRNSHLMIQYKSTKYFQKTKCYYPRWHVKKSYEYKFSFQSIKRRDDIQVVVNDEKGSRISDNIRCIRTCTLILSIKVDSVQNHD